MTATVRPSRSWYAFAAVLVVAALVVVIIGIVRLVGAVSNFEFTDVASSGTVTVGERDLAVWDMTGAAVECSSTDEQSRDSFRRTNVNATVSINNRTYFRVGTVRGAPGSTHQLSCSTLGGAEPVIAISDEPQVGRQVRNMVLTGLGAFLLAGAAFVTTLVVFFKRRSSRRQTDGPHLPPGTPA